MKRARAYRIETDRLVIRCYAPEDAAMLKAAIDGSLEHLLPWMPWAKGEPESIETKVLRLAYFREQFEQGLDYAFGIFDKAEKELIGSTGLHTRVGAGAREIGYWINVKHLHKGYATEAVSALTKVGFEVEEMERIEIHCSKNNISSQRVPEKLGYTLKEIKKQKDREVMVWVMDKDAFGKSDIGSMKVRVYDGEGMEIGVI